jgi:DNA-binding PadR family transcriptional regulator
MSDEFGSEGPSGPEGFGRRRRFGAEALKIVILHLLQREPRHGYELLKAIEGLSAGLYSPSPGMIYPMLTLLADQGLISELPGGDGKRCYAITAEGEAALAAAEAELQDALARLARIASAAGRSDDHARVRQAMGDLRTAVRDRLDSKADADTAAHTAERIAEIIDTATRAIAALED